MAITEHDRHSLHLCLDDVLGHDQAGILMAHLPPTGWPELATKADLRTEATLLRSEISTLGTELRSELAQVGTELRSEISTLGTELRGEMSTLELRIERSLREQTRTLLYANLGFASALVAATLAGARL